METCPNGRQLGRIYGQLDDIESLLLFYAEKGGKEADPIRRSADIVQEAMIELQRAIDIINGRSKE